MEVVSSAASSGSRQELHVQIYYNSESLALFNQLGPVGCFDYCRIMYPLNTKILPGKRKTVKECNQYQIAGDIKEISTSISNHFEKLETPQMSRQTNHIHNHDILPSLIEATRFLTPSIKQKMVSPNHLESFPNIRKATPLLAKQKDKSFIPNP